MERTKETIQQEYINVNAQLGELLINKPELAQVIQLVKKTYELKQEFLELEQKENSKPIEAEIVE